MKFGPGVKNLNVVYVKHRAIVRNVEEDGVVHVDHVELHPVVRKLEDDDMVHIDLV